MARGPEGVADILAALGGAQQGLFTQQAAANEESPSQAKAEPPRDRTRHHFHSIRPAPHTFRPVHGHWRNQGRRRGKRLRFDLFRQAVAERPGERFAGGVLALKNGSAEKTVVGAQCAGLAKTQAAITATGAIARCEVRLGAKHRASRASISLLAGQRYITGGAQFDRARRTFDFRSAGHAGRRKEEVRGSRRAGSQPAKLPFVAREHASTPTLSS